MIGGNISAIIQIKSSKKNELGEGIIEWTNVQTIKGFLDMLSGQAEYRSYNAKIEESSHIFIGDFVFLDKRIKSENARMVIDKDIYDVSYIDNPMNLNKHLEIYLKYIGGI